MAKMVITCPECSTAYKADPKSIGPNGRTVRCARCEATWFVPGPDAIALDEDLSADELIESEAPAETLFDDTAADAAPPPAVSADVMLRNQADAVRLRRRKRTLRLIWIVTGLLVLAAIVTAYVNRQEIVNRQPETASLYRALGIEVRAGGLTFVAPTAKTTLVDGRPVIRVEGAVRNLSREAVTIPLIELTLHDPSGTELVQWFVEPAENRLASQGRLPFVTEYADPPSDVTSLRYRFASR